MTEITRVTAAETGQPARPVPDARARDSSSDARDFLRAVWNRRYFTLVAGLVLAGLGAAWSLISPRRYEASLTLAVLPSQVVGPVVSTVRPQDIQAASVANFSPIISSHAAVASVVKEFKLDQPPRAISPSRFIDRVLTVKPLDESNLVRVIVQLDDPDLAARVTNRLVERSIALARSASENGSASLLMDLKRVVDEAESRMRNVDAQYEEHRRTEQLRPHRQQEPPPGDSASREALQSRLELARTLTRNSLETAVGRYQSAQLDAIVRVPQVVVVDAAVPPEYPVSHRLARNVGLGLLAGLLFGAFGAVAEVLRRGYQRD